MSKLWFSERIKQTQRTSNLIFSLCCSKGNVLLPLLIIPPETLLRLYFDIESTESRDFLEHCRAYNSMFAFTSMVGRIDRSVNDGKGRFYFDYLVRIIIE